MATKDALMTKLADKAPVSGDRITVVGSGQVGMAIAFALLTQGISTDIVLIDMAEDKLRGEMLDLQHGSLFLKGASINASTDYCASAGSKICVVTAGARQKEGETRLNLVQRNTDIMKGIIPQLVKNSPDTILIIVSNPCDVLTYVAWKVSGLPKNRVIGSGTNLDTSRFRFLLSQRLGVSPNSVHGWIIGEHGDTSVPVWSGVNVAGVRLREVNPKFGTEDDPENYKQIHKDVVGAAYEVIKLKGYTNWAVGLSVAQICQSILKNTNNVHAVTTSLKGYHGIEKGVFLSVPCSLGKDGVTNVVHQVLTEEERAQLHRSAEAIDEIQSALRI
ncbi:L-lactate dehydrogenase isoform X2 [Aethina tumida]|uniref:L-lactate dehydrogenase isoform X2 n=1 Tax=Aethina tumida TaxID=116153 RepID=UPI00096B5923|nr:L-lactate dehydrogenase isoform X2 [Aethina tumida]